MGIVFKNNAKTTLASNLTSSATSASVTDGSVFPSLSAGEFFLITFDDGTNNEICKCTARSGNTLTIVRAQESTTARAFSSGDAAEGRVTAGVLETIQENIAAKSANQTVYNTTTASSATDYDIGIDPSVEANAMVFLNGVMQHHDTFSFSGSTLSFDTAPPDGMALEVIVDNLINLQSSNLTVDTFTAADVGGNPQTDFVLSDTPAAETNLIVFVDGVFQDQDAYTISSNTLTITDGVTADFGVTVYVINPVNIGTPSDGTVTSAKLSGNITMPADLTVTGDVAFDSPTFVVDNANSRVGLGTASPSVPVDIVGDVKMSANLTVDTSTLHVDSTNNRVGIGTTSPAKTLHLASGSSVIRLEDTDGGYGEVSGSNGNIRLRADEGNTQASSFMSFDIDSTEEMRLTSTGLGIGTTSPASALEVNNSSAGDTVATFEGDYGAGGDVQLVRYERGGGAVYGAISYKDATTDIEFGNISSHALSFTTGNTRRLTIDSSGNVGIATASPVNNGAGSQGLTINGTGNYQNLSLQVGGTTQFTIYTNGTSGTFINQVTADPMMFYTSDTERMRIDSSGNLLVNQTSAGVNGKLQVTGGIGLTGNSEIRQSTNSDGSTLRFLGTQFVAGSSNAVGYSYSSGAQIASVSNSANVLLFEAGASNTSGHRLTIQNDATGLQGEVKYAGSEPVFILRDTRSAGGTAWSDSANEPLGEIEFWTSDGTGIGPHAVARIRTVNDITAASPSGAITFMTSGYNNGSPTEKMRINSSGQVLIGTSTNPTYNHRCVVSGSANIDGVLRVEDTDGTVALSNAVLGLAFPNDADATSGYFVYMTDGNGAIGSISVASGTSVSFNTTSDERLKKNIVDASSQLDTIKNIKVREFDWNKNDYHEVGVIAQEIINVVPNAVQEGGDDVTKHPFGVDYGKIVPYLIKAIQEQQAQIETLKQEIREIREGG